MQFEKPPMKKLDAEKVDENVKKMQDNIDTLIAEKQEKDLLSGSFNQYMKTPHEYV